MELFSCRAVLLVTAIFLASCVTENVQARKHRRHKRASCEARYSQIDSQHTACLRKSSNSKDSGVSKADQTVIVDEHNKERRSVKPAATDMMAMTWDDGLANTAQKWADNCNMAHDSNYKRNDYGRFSVGQNLALGNKGWAEAIKAWADEKQFYDYNTNKAHTPGEAVGHYTQVVWAKSVKVGCGFAKCSNLKDMPFYVCNYGPAGNMKGEKPYTSGGSCGACPKSCNNKLCDCKNTVCKNGGTMDPDACTCACTASFYEAPDCTLNCNAAKAEPSQCGQLKMHCKLASNVPQMCPQSCGWCPAASNA